MDRVAVLLCCLCCLLSHMRRTSGDRVLFHESGHQGPHTYKFGYDTGAGSHNRQFRYEERDSSGMVHGKYGYYDKYGKPHVVYYQAHPHHGYEAKGDFGKYGR